MNFFEAKVNYVKVTEEGKEKKVTETYLVDAMSLTEMEARTIKELGNVTVPAGKESNISSIYRNEEGDRFFKAKVVYKDEDDKKVTEYNLVESTTVELASKFLKAELSDSVAPFEIVSVGESNIIDVFNFED